MPGVVIYQSETTKSYEAPTAEEKQMGDNIVNGWNKIVTHFENQTMAFVKLVNQHLESRPKDSVIRTMHYVYTHPEIKRTVSIARIWQGLRLIKSRPDLLTFQETGQAQRVMYTKDDGSVFWEFYFELYKHKISDALRVALETDGITNKWSLRKLRAEIQKFKLENSEKPLDKVPERNALIRGFKFLLFRLNKDRLFKVKDYVFQLVKEQEEEENLEGKENGQNKETSTINTNN